MRPPPPWLLALLLVAGVALAGCMDRAPEPADANASEESALDESSTREQFEAGADGADEGGVVSDAAELAPGTVLGSALGALLWAAPRP